MSDLSKYLERDRVETGVQAGDNMLLGPRTDADIHIDEEGYENVVDVFEPQSKDPLTSILNDINNYFGNKRPRTYNGFYQDDERFPLTENGNVHFSNIMEEKTGECSEMAVAAQICAEEIYDNFTTHLVHGGVKEAEEGLDTHAYVILENDEPDSEEFFDGNSFVVDPGMLVVDSIEGVGEGSKFEYVVLDGNWKEQHGCIHTLP